MPRLKITRFAAQAECHYQATQQGNARTANRAYAQIVRAKDSLVAGGHLAALVPLLCHEHAAVQQNNVQFCPLTPAQIAAYIATGEPLDKAGAYGIQGIGGVFVQHLAGSFTGVMGLPVFETIALLQRCGAAVPPFQAASCA